MQTRALIATAVAVVAVFPTVSSAAREGVSTRAGSGHRAAVGHSSAGVKRAKGTLPGIHAGASSGDGVYVAPFGSVPIVTSIYIYEPGGAMSPDTLSQADACASLGSGCSDEQLCAIWAINCSAGAVSPDPASQADACADFASGCTPAQVCAIWSLDCAAGPQPPDATAEVPRAAGG